MDSGTSNPGHEARSNIGLSSMRELHKSVDDSGLVR